MRTGSPFNAWFKGHHREEFAWFAIADSLPVLSIDGRAGGRTDRRRLPPWRRRAASVSWPAKAGDRRRCRRARHAIACAMAIDQSAAARRRQTGLAETRATADGRADRDWAPSLLTTLTDRAAAENNELPRPER